MKLENIFCIGAHKTGTTSLTKAMGSLGYCAMPEDLAYTYLTRNFDDLLSFARTADYDFFEDSPFNLFDNYKKISRYFSSAKIILTTRDPDSWFDSVFRWNEMLGYPDIYQEIYGCKIIYKDKKKIVNTYKNRNEEILRYYKKNKNFLSINICGGEGWQEICCFLGYETINKPFFKENSNNSHT